MMKSAIKMRSPTSSLFAQIFLFALARIGNDNKKGKSKGKNKSNCKGKYGDSSPAAQNDGQVKAGIAPGLSLG